MTIRELFREFVAAKQRLDDQRDHETLLAYRIAAWHPQRTKQLPQFQSLLSTHRAPVVQTSGDMRTMVQALSQYYKIPLRKGLLRTPLHG